MTITEAIHALHQTARELKVDLAHHLGDDEDITVFALNFLAANLFELASDNEWIPDDDADTECIEQQELEQEARINALLREIGY